jgi:hypothetical protein
MSVNKKVLAPLTVAPKAVLAADADVEPVPPFVNANVPPKVIAPDVAVEGVKPVDPAEKVVTPVDDVK